MSTNSTITIKQANGVGKTIYCHWDGYASNNGEILKNHYKTAERVMELIKLGSISILNKNIGVKTKFNGFDSNKEQQCLAYKRDRGDTGCGATTTKFVGNRPILNDRQDWNYLFDNGKWYVSRGYDVNNPYVPLTNAIIKTNHVPIPRVPKVK